jgi:hypothetical protein
MSIAWSRMKAILSVILRGVKQGRDSKLITGFSPFHSILEKIQCNLNLLQDAYVVQHQPICSSVPWLENSIKKETDSNHLTHDFE